MMKKIHDNLFRLPPALVKFLCALAFTLMAAAPVAGLTHIRDIARPLGERPNKLIGWGVVVGLNGTGDGDMPITARPIASMLQKLGNPPANLAEIAESKNAAFVMISAEFGRNGVRNGDKIDVKVSSLGKAKSLAGGILVSTPLRSINAEDQNYYAWAEGPVSLPDPKHTTSGIIKDGAVVDADFMIDYLNQDTKTKNHFFDLILDDSPTTFQTAKAVAMQIEALFTAPGAGTEQTYISTDRNVRRVAVALDPRTVRVVVPPKQVENPAGFIAKVLNLPIELPHPEATIVINEKTGTIVITGNVEIAPCTVTVNGLTIRIVDPQPQPAPNQPIIKDSRWSKIDTTGEGTAQINELTDILDQLNVPVWDQIHVINDIDKAGALRARVIRQ